MKRRSFLGLLLGIPFAVKTFVIAEPLESVTSGYSDSDLDKTNEGDWTYEKNCFCQCNTGMCVSAKCEDDWQEFEVTLDKASWEYSFDQQGYQTKAINIPRNVSLKRNVRHQFQRR